MSTDLIEQLFNDAVQLPPQHRDKALSSVRCTSEVKDAVRQLLQAYEQSSSLLNEDLVADLERMSPGFLDTSPESECDTVSNATQIDDSTLKRGQRIGNYVIEKVIGAGGMSVVYRAKQTEPIERHVAIKLVRPSNATQTVLKRFLREQQAVSLLRHPNIAALHEVTQTQDGRPVAVMELIRGKSITEFCNHHRLNWKHRVRVFLKACKGLSHAHCRGIVHRDIKPENILVAVEDRKPSPKLIDFGIAMIKRTDLGNNLTLTQAGQLLGTPRYMSPEQFENSRKLNHKSDIYSAALVLFELLAGVPYHEGETAQELIAKSCKTDPDRLSLRIRNVASAKGGKLLNGEPPAILAKIATRDLDWILSKALARDPKDRYEDVVAFAKDLQAAVKGQPTSVSAPSLTVRSQKFVRRHYGPIWSVVSLILVLLLSAAAYQKWNSDADLVEARRMQTVQVQKAAAANELIMTLLASAEYKLTPKHFDLSSAPTYREHCQKIRKHGGPKSEQDRYVYGILAVMEAMTGDFDRAEILMETADVEHGSEELRAVRDKICESYADAAKMRLEELDAQGESFERALQQMTLARCYFVWGMYGDGERLITEASDYFESQSPYCYESLMARLTRIKILQRSGRLAEMRELLVETQQRFRNQHELLSDTRGETAWSVITQLAQNDNS